MIKTLNKTGKAAIAERLNRRTFLLGVAAVGAATAWGADSTNRSASETKRNTVTIENFSAAGKSEGRSEVAKVVKTDDAWKKQLSSASYQVARHEGTEAPGSGAYLNNHESGLYRCICCDTALFDSQTKFESGTGWPSFWQPISKANVTETADRTLGMERVAVSCARCDAHLGHVFDDGPKPTGLRYCMNSVALHFVPRPAAPAKS